MSLTEAVCPACGAERYQPRQLPKASEERPGRVTSRKQLQFFWKGVALVLTAFIGYFAAVSHFSNPASVGELVSSEHSKDKGDHGHSIASWLQWNSPEIAGTQPSSVTTSQEHAGMGLMMTLSQGGYVSKQLLGCWRGTTAEQPTEWRILSFAGLLETYHRDHIDICLTWDNQTLKLTDEQYSCAACSYSPDRRSSYHVVSATGNEVTLAQEDSVGMGVMAGKGQARFKLNQDDTVDEQIDETNYLSGLPAIQVETTAHLQRKGS